MTFTWHDGAAVRAGGAGGVATVDRTWHHYAFVKNGTNIRNYVDGVEFANATPTGASTITASTAGLGVGRLPDSTASCAGGCFAEIRIWNVARSATDIAAYRDQLATGLEAGLVACWHLDSISGTTEADVVSGLLMQLSGAQFLPSEFPPPRPTVYEGGGDGGASVDDLNNALAEWLSQSDLTHPDSLPKVNYDLIAAIRSKLGFLEGSLDVQILDFRAWAEFAVGELEVGIAKIDDQTKPSPGVPPVPNDVILAQLLAAIAAHDAASVAAHQDIDSDLAAHDSSQDQHLEYVAQSLSGHAEFSLLDPELPPWSITSDVNDHTDEALILLQGDLNDHEESTVARVNAHTSDESSRVEGAINQHSDALSTIEIAAIATGTVNVNQHTDEVGAAINLHTTAETDAVVNTVNIHADANLAVVQSTIISSEERLAEQAAVNRGAIEDHVTAEANRVIAAMPEGGESEADRIISEVNAETNRVGASIIDSNDNQTGILIAVQSALAAVTLTVNTILEKVEDMVSQLTTALAGIAEILAWVRSQPGGAQTPVKIAETTFANTTYWAQSAHYYEIEILEKGDQSGAQPIPNGQYFRFMGWCAARVAGKYVYGSPLAFSSQRIDVGSIVPDGLLVFVKPGATGRVAAFQYQ
jgi:hypothetical protein